MSATLTEAPRTAPAPRNRREFSQGLVLAVILSSQLMVVLDATIVNVALPAMQTSLGFSEAGLSWVLNAYTLTFGGLLLLGARAGDLLGRRRTFVAGVVLFSVASLLGGFATSPGLLLAARALQGVGGALAAPSSLALMTTMFTDGAARMRALALFTAVSVSGGALGLMLGGMLTEWTTWRWVMFVNVPLGVAVALAGRAVLPETGGRHGRFDLPGAVTSTAGMTLVVYGFIHAATDGWATAGTVASFAAGLALMAVFVAVELRAEEPITPLRLLADPSRTGANVARGLLFAGMFGMFFFLTQFLQEVLDYSALRTGFAFLPMPTTVFVVSQLTSRKLIHVVPGKALMLGGVALAGTGFLLASGLDASSSYPHVVLCLLLFATGNGLSFVPLTSAALAGVTPQDAGAASGRVNGTQRLGGAGGGPVLVTVAHTGDGFLDGAQRAFAGAAGFLALAFLLVAVAVRAPKVAH